MKIKWIRLNPGASADDGNYSRSLEGRFDISPRFRHTIYPDSYQIVDYLKKDASGKSIVKCCNRITDCKNWAEEIVFNEINKERGLTS